MGTFYWPHHLEEYTLLSIVVVSARIIYSYKVAPKSKALINNHYQIVLKTIIYASFYQLCVHDEHYNIISLY